LRDGPPIGVRAEGPSDLAHVPGGERPAHLSGLPKMGGYHRRPNKDISGLLAASGANFAWIVAGQLSIALAAKALHLACLMPGCHL
jgi:hypothetical protein